MQVKPTQLAEVIELTPTRHGDHRGWFAETWNTRRGLEAGIDITWVQDNESLSAEQGTVRGLHFQMAPSAQDKLIRVLDGRIADVAVDLRRSSATFGHHVLVELNAELGNQLFVPKGFAHGFCTLEPNTRVAYKTSGYYDPERDVGLRWNDPDLGITWPVGEGHAVVSAKDGETPLLADAQHLLFD